MLFASPNKPPFSLARHEDKVNPSSFGSETDPNQASHELGWIPIATLVVCGMVMLK
jgi:hypothetical protein